MSALDGRELILGVTGSIAAYKAVYLLRELTRAGARVSVCLSEHAREFVGPLTFRTLSGRPVLSHLFDPQSDDAVEHVALAERADAVVVAPATANLLGKAAAGIADDFLTTLLLAARCPVVMAPAMDGGMWEHPAVVANVATLRGRGVTVLEPDAGALAADHRVRARADGRGDARSGAAPRGRRRDRDQGGRGGGLPRAAGRRTEDQGQARPDARPRAESRHPGRGGRARDRRLHRRLRRRDERRRRQRPRQARGQGHRPA